MKSFQAHLYTVEVQLSQISLKIKCTYWRKKILKILNFKIFKFKKKSFFRNNLLFNDLFISKHLYLACS